MSFTRLGPIIFLCLLLTGCLPTGGAVRSIEFYTLEYAPPAPKGAQVDASVKVDRFSAARLYDSTDMVYRSERYRVASYNYHRWRATPADMASDYLARDFENSHLFRAIFSHHHLEAARFAITGTVEEFVETKESGTWKARLGLRITLLDRSRQALPEQVVMQKEYGVSKDLADESPEAFAAGMSADLAEASAQVISDVSSAISRRLTGEDSWH